MVKVERWFSCSRGLPVPQYLLNQVSTLLTVGTVFRPIFDRLKIPREKLAYIGDSISAPTCILIPLNAWGAYIMGLIAAQGFSNPLTILVYAFPFNFYPMLAMAMVLFVILSGKDFGPMKKAEHRAQKKERLFVMALFHLSPLKLYHWRKKKM